MESRGYRKMLPVYLGEVGEKFHQKYIHTLEMAVTKFTLWCLCAPHLTQGLILSKNQMLQNSLLIFVVLR